MPSPRKRLRDWEYRHESTSNLHFKPHDAYRYDGVLLLSLAGGARWQVTEILGGRWLTTGRPEKSNSFPVPTGFIAPVAPGFF